MSQEKPFFTKSLFVVLIVAGLTSAGVTYWYQKPPAKQANPTAKNPNVKPLKRETMQEWRKKSRLSQEQSYIARKVFPFISKNQKPVKDCYFGYRGKEKLPVKTGARLTVQFKIHKGGKVSNVGIYTPKGKAADKSSFNTRLKIKSVQTCVLTAVGKWKFPIHHFPKAVDMQYPFFFR